MHLFRPDLGSITFSIHREQTSCMWVTYATGCTRMEDPERIVAYEL